MIPQNKFHPRCGEQPICIEDWKVCDGTFHCTNLADEVFELCAEWKCPDGFLKLSGKLKWLG